jgi:hypothetical protein
MANNIAGLFKELGNNDVIKKYIEDGVQNKVNNDDIHLQIVNDVSLMALLTSYVENTSIINDKVKIFVGQQVKKLVAIETKKNEKGKEKVSIKISEGTCSDEDKDEENDNVVEIKPCVLPLTDKPRWLFPGCYVEQIGIRMHMVNGDFECYY